MPVWCESSYPNFYQDVYINAKNNFYFIYFTNFLQKVPFKGLQMVRMSKSGLALAPTLTLKVLINNRSHKNVPF